MQIPSVSGLFQSKVGEISSRVPVNMSSFTDSFENEYAQAVDDSSNQAEDNLQQLNVQPGSTGDQTDASANGFAAQGLLAQGSSFAPTVQTPYVFAGKSAYSMGLPASSALGNKVASFAEQFVGTPYVWGGEDLQKGTDCSGFTQSVYKNFGINLPRTAYRQSMVGTQVSPDQMQPGDLLFFKYSDRAPVTHVAMYIGDGKIIQAIGNPHGVTISSLNGNWQKDLVTVKRILPQ